MKLRLNAEHLQELNDEQFNRLRQWWEKESYDGEEPLLTTNQMVDLLQSMGVGISIFVPLEEHSAKDSERIPDDDVELFNSIWGFVKESL